MATVASLINMKGGVGKSTLTFNLAWALASDGHRVLAIDLDPQANLSQYFLGARRYLKLMSDPRQKSVVDIFEQYSATNALVSSPTVLSPPDAIHTLDVYGLEEGQLNLVPSRLELAWTLKNPTEKSELLPKFIAEIQSGYDVILIDCAPTESILTIAAYRSSRYVFVPVRPEFLATIGLPLLARSLDEFRRRHQNHRLTMGGIIFNGLRRTNAPPEQVVSQEDVERVAEKQGWPVFENVVHHSDSYATGSRAGEPIFRTQYALDYVREEFDQVAEEFMEALSL